MTSLIGPFLDSSRLRCLGMVHLVLPEKHPLDFLYLHLADVTSIGVSLHTHTKFKFGRDPRG